MKEEIAVIRGEPKDVYKNGKDVTDGFTSLVLEEWHNPTPLLRSPQFVAFRVKGEKWVATINEVDAKNSEFEKGIIKFADARDAFPILVKIPLRFARDTLEQTKYTTFRKLLTHESAADL